MDLYVFYVQFCTGTYATILTIDFVIKANIEIIKIEFAKKYVIKKCIQCRFLYVNNNYVFNAVQ